MLIQEFDQLLANLLDHRSWVGLDRSLNGLQVERRNPEVHRVALAVDACRQSFEGAVAAGADLLVVHHGLFWGEPLAVTGGHAARLRYLFEHDLALWASHLPLDAHPSLGHNACLAQALGLQDVQPFGQYRHTRIGVRGSLPQPMTAREICALLFGGPDQVLGVLEFGPRQCTSVGVVSGGAPQTVTEAIAEGLDLYLTGDLSHTIHHQAREAGINVISGGHYATETWGLQALAEHLARTLDLSTVFLDYPTRA